MTEAIDPILHLFRTRGRFVLTTHINPDGDGIGSEIALGAWLRERGKDVHVINAGPVPAVYRFLDARSTISTFDPQRDLPLIAGADAIVVLDTNHPDRLGAMKGPVLESPAQKVCIDHHLDPDPFAALALIDEDATSTGEILYRLLFAGGEDRPGEEAASGLYTAIMTDTGSFRYPRTGPATHTIVSRLIACGADPVRIYAEVFERWSPGRIHLLGEVLKGLTTEFGGRLAHITVTREMLSRTGTTEEDTDNFTTYPMSVGGVRVGILFLDIDGGVKISFRSKGTIPINALAMEFGGNGHRNAAGARIAGASSVDVRARVVSAAGKYLTEGA
ncbi:MAG TPA: bifunctional oligoribonuclease/PAP phosphatase NrnA [Bacteroidota bacterium]|nr:bifunctional oligoribonuclease/PAP phosphatase NrnA [Bacteroidota bacterium]